MISRREWLLAAVATGCTTRSPSKPRAVVELRQASALPRTTLPWLELTDHFVATVGAHAGEGRPVGPLLVLADATFAPRSRFPQHAHRDVEILSVVLAGSLSHQGDGANGQVIAPRGVQLISARDGMTHAEGNETDASTHMLQLWLQPTLTGGAAQHFYRQLPASPGRYVVAGDDGMPLRCDAKLWWIDVQGSATIELRAGRQGYGYVVDGRLTIEGVIASAGDGVLVKGETCAVTGTGALLWIDLPIR